MHAVPKCDLSLQERDDWTSCFTCICPRTHAGVDGALEVSHGGTYWRTSGDAVPVRARLSCQATRRHTLRKQAQREVGTLQTRACTHTHSGWLCKLHTTHPSF